MPRRQQSPPRTRQRRQHSQEAVQTDEASDVEQSELARQIAALAEAVRELKKPVAAPSRTPCRPAFAGADSQCPDRFLEKFEAYAARLGIEDEEDKAAELTCCLEGAAASYVDTFPTAGLTATDMAQLLRMRFAGPEVINKLRVRLHTEQQKATEAVLPFILAKQHLSKRLYPGATEAENIERILPLLRPQLAGIVKLHKPRTLDRLKELAISVETSFPAETTASQTTRPAAARPPPAAARPPPVATRPSTSGDGLPDCHYCPGRHWHRDCPVAQGRMQGNARPAGHAQATVTGGQTPQE